MQEFAKQLKHFRLSRKLKQREIAAVLDVTPTAVSDYESGKRTPSLDMIVQLASRYNLDLTWFITGKGDMYNSTRTREDTPEKLISMPVVSSIAAGCPVEAYQDDEPSETIQVPLSLLHLPPPYFAFRVEGESMSPLILDGDIVILSQDWRGIQLHDRICGFRTHDGITLKKMVIQPSQKTTWLMPINILYTPIPYNEDTEDLVMFGVLVISIRKYL